MAHGPYARPPLSNRKTRLLILVGGIIISIAVAITTYNRMTMETRLAVEPRTTPPTPIPDAPAPLKDGELTFIKKNGDIISRIDLEIAETDESMARGLMFRTQMEEAHGMIFIFPDEDFRHFWMKNTLLSLDMLFVRANGEIVTILENTKPFDESTYNSTAPAMYVVEVNAGYTKKYHISVGDKIHWNRL